MGGTRLNTRRLAELFRRQAEISAEIAHALEEAEPDNAPPPRRRAPAPRLVAPVAEPSEIDKARARAVLERRGFHVRAAR